MNYQKIKQLMLRQLDGYPDDEVSHYVDKSGKQFSLKELKILIEKDDPDLFNWFEDQLLDSLLND
jgi:succinate dehydrogenase flavin-adding protein (antitoxin of CptAB toxin-antitoxin module)